MFQSALRGLGGSRGSPRLSLHPNLAWSCSTSTCCVQLGENLQPLGAFWGEREDFWGETEYFWSEKRIFGVERHQSKAVCVLLTP